MSAGRRFCPVDSLFDRITAMNEDISRRTALKWTTVAAGAAAVGIGHGTQIAFAAANAQIDTYTDGWNRTHDRVWLGSEFWANPMEDWRVVDGAAECQSLGGNRSIHSVTHQITNPAGFFAMTVRVRQVASNTYR